jgi:CelD/BcsL family acetyltransferase involved in cellulose biosynthesis
MFDIALLPVTDWEQLGEQWRELEARADCSFFQSWTWMGCLAEERFPDPVLLRAERDGRIVAMALFNRRHGRLARETLWLSESGDPTFDSVYIEYNGLLRDVTEPETLLDECVRAMRAAPISRQRQRGRRIVLSGVDGAMPTALRSGGHHPWVRRAMAAPYVELCRLRQGGDKYLATLSANTRYQIRRSDRAYEALGGLVGRCAESNVEAHEFLAALADLHQTTWVARRKLGAFANPFFVRFHRELIERGLPRGEIELLRVTAGEQIVGFLYNYRFRLQVLAYQSGFDYAHGARHCKPGMTCHHQAIKRAIASGMNRYDFLAGEDRYKRSLANAEDVLYWVEDGAGAALQRYAAPIRDWLRGALVGSRGRAAMSDDA